MMSEGNIWPVYETRDAELADLMTFFHFSYLRDSQYTGTVMFEMLTGVENEAPIVRTIRCDPQSGVQVFCGMPPDEKLTCHVTLPYETFSDLFWGRTTSRSLVMNGGCQVHNWAYRELLNFGLSFAMATPHWERFYSTDLSYINPHSTMSTEDQLSMFNAIQEAKNNPAPNPIIDMPELILPQSIHPSPAYNIENHQQLTPPDSTDEQSLTNLDYYFPNRKERLRMVLRRNGIDNQSNNDLALSSISCTANMAENSSATDWSSIPILNSKILKLKQILKDIDQPTKICNHFLSGSYFFSSTFGLEDSYTRTSTTPHYGPQSITNNGHAMVPPWTEKIHTMRNQLSDLSPLVMERMRESIHSQASDLNEGFKNFSQNLCRIDSSTHQRALDSILSSLW